MKVQQAGGSFALCVEDGGMEDLEARKVYQVCPTAKQVAKAASESSTNAARTHMYSSGLFVPVKLPAAVVRRFKRRTAATPSTARRSIRRAG
jgi:hypothetical protein